MLTNELVMTVQLWPHKENAPSLSPGKGRSEWPLIFLGLCHTELWMPLPAFCSRCLVSLCFWHTLGSGPRSSCWSLIEITSGVIWGLCSEITALEALWQPPDGWEETNHLKREMQVCLHSTCLFIRGKWSSINYQESQKLLAEWLFFKWACSNAFKRHRGLFAYTGATSRPTHYTKQLNCENPLLSLPLISLSLSLKHKNIFIFLCHVYIGKKLCRVDQAFKVI